MTLEYKWCVCVRERELVFITLWGPLLIILLQSRINKDVCAHNQIRFRNLAFFMDYVITSHKRVSSRKSNQKVVIIHSNE